MNIGREIIASLLDGGDIKTLLSSGFDKNWLDGNDTGSQVIFSGDDRRAYQWILSHWVRYRTVPDISVFRQRFPEESLPFSKKIIPLDELADLASDKVNSFLLADMIGRLIDLHDEGKISKAISYLSSRAPALSSGIKDRKIRADDISSKDFDIESLLSKEMEMGIPFGIPAIDEEFYGFQPGQLITLMGRQKSGKSWSTINSALNAWREGYTVLLFSVEMDVSVFHQRVLCLGSNVSASRMRRGRLAESEKKKVRDFHSQLTEEEGRFLISKKKSLITVSDIREEIELYNPHIVFIDGFSFMIDEKSGKLTSDWQANENVAYALKELAMEEQIVMFVNTQVQEKQYSAKHGIEARTIASGTGLLKASDLVMGQDKDGDYITINCVYSRYEYFDDVVMEIDWDSMELAVVKEKLEDMGV